MNPADTLGRIRELHQQAHRDDPDPTNESERLALWMLERTKVCVQDALLSTVNADAVEMALFISWLQLVSILHTGSDKKFYAWLEVLHQAREAVIKHMEHLGATLQDDGPTQPLQELGQLLQALKPAIAATPASHWTEHLEQVLVSLRGLVAEAFERGVHPGLVESLLLYRWLRMSTINAPRATEELFQKLERNWSSVVPEARRRLMAL